MGSSRAMSPPARGLSRHLRGRHARGRKVPALWGSWGWARGRCGPSSLVGVKTERGEDGSPAAALLREMGEAGLVGTARRRGTASKEAVQSPCAEDARWDPWAGAGGGPVQTTGRMGAARLMEVCVTSKVCSHWVTLVTVLGQSV